MPVVDLIFCIMGIAALAYGITAVRNPQLILRGRRAKQWVARIGEKKTLSLGKFVGIPLALIFGLFLFWLGVSGRAQTFVESSRHHSSAK